MVSVLDLMILCLDVVSVEDFAKAGLTPYVLTPFIHARVVWEIFSKRCPA